MRKMAYGQWEPYVDADPVRAHLADLRGQGVGLKKIAAVAGVSQGGISKIVYGLTKNGAQVRPPSKRVRRETAEKLLGVTIAGLIASDIAGHFLLDGTGTRRRLQALVALGWSISELGRRLGMGNTTKAFHLVNGTANGAPGNAFVFANTDKKVRVLYDALSMRRPEPRNRHEKAAVTRALNLAAERGWPPPLAWDDETIDDPASIAVRLDSVARARDEHVDEVAVQRRMHGDKSVRLSKKEKVELIERWAKSGRSLAECERHTGVNPHRDRTSQVEAS